MDIRTDSFIIKFLCFCSSFLVSNAFFFREMFRYTIKEPDDLQWEWEIFLVNVMFQTALLLLHMSMYMCFWYNKSIKNEPIEQKANLSIALCEMLHQQITLSLGFIFYYFARSISIIASSLSVVCFHHFYFIFIIIIISS